MRVYLLWLGWVFLVPSMMAQTIHVYDDQTGQPLDRVNIFSMDTKASAVTNARGRTDFEAFKGSDSIVFKHIAYEVVVLSYDRVKSMNFKIALKEKPLTFGEVVVSASRWEEEEAEAPVRIERVTAEETAFQNPQTAADLLGSGGYAYIQKSQMGGGSPILRGFATNRVMLVVDGVRMNNAIFRTGNLQNVISLDANAVDRSETLFGPGSVMYGSDAIGGVMDFHLIEPHFSFSSKPEFSGSGMTRYASANTEKTQHVQFNAGWRRFAMTSAMTFSDYGDLKAGSAGEDYFLRPDYQARIDGVDSFKVNKDDRLQRASAYHQLNLLQKLSFRIGDDWTLTYGWYYSRTSDVPRYDRLYQKDDNGNFAFAKWYYGPQSWIMNKIGLTRTRKGLLFDDFRWVAALQNYEESRHDRRYRNSRIRNQTETVDAWSMNIDFTKDVGESLKVFYGAEAVYNTVGSKANRRHIVTNEITATNTRYPDGATWASYAGYASAKYYLNSQWIVNSGIRLSHVRTEADFDTTFFDFPFLSTTNANSALNGSLGIVYMPFDYWQWYASLSTGFRAPNVDDIGKVFESEPGSVVVPNPDLKPEYAYNAEIGTSFSIEDRVKTEVSTYYTFLDDALARRPFRFNGEDSIVYDGSQSAVQAIQNLSKAYVWGVQAGFEWQFAQSFKLTSRISYQFGKEKDADSSQYYPLRHAAPLFGNTHITCKIKKWEADLYANYNARMNYGDLALSERSDNLPYAKDSDGKPFVPGWLTLNLKAAYYVNSNLTVYAGVENITDRLYRPYSSGISAAGRNYILSLKYQM